MMGTQNGKHQYIGKNDYSDHDGDDDDDDDHDGDDDDDDDNDC